MNAQDPYKKLFARLPGAEPGALVIPTVLGRIDHARTVKARLHAMLHGTLILATVIAFVPALNSFLASAARSGFSSYVSLGMSDWALMLGSWKAFILSIVETAPILETGVIISLVLIFANSLRRGMRYVIPSISSAHTGVLA